MEKSLILIKPDAMKKNAAGEILSRLQNGGLKLVALKMLRMDETLGKRHYSEHVEKPFYKDLLEFMTSAPIVAAVFEGEDAVERIRKIMGVTDSTKADEGTIRRDFGTDIQFNAVHGSDSVESAKREISLFFTEDEIFDY